MRSIYSVPGALTSHHKYTGQEHREGDQREGNRNDLKGTAKRNKPKSKKRCTKEGR